MKITWMDDGMLMTNLVVEKLGLSIDLDIAHEVGE